VLLKGLGKLKKFNGLIRNRTRDLPACSIVPEPTSVPSQSTNSINNSLKGNSSLRNKEKGYRRS
jgi:hypothetical protein